MFKNIVPKDKKILFIINGLGYGGAETHLLRLSKALLDKNFKVSILTITDDLALLERLDKRIKHINIPLRKNLYLLKDIKNILKTVKQLKPDVIHAHLFQANIISRMIKFFYSNIRVVNTTHGSYLLENRFYNPYKIYKLTQHWVDFHTAVSEEVLRYLLQNKSINIEKSKYLPNGIFIATNTINKEKHDKFKWVSVGRLHYVKNYYGLIGIISKMTKKNYNLSLDIAGDGEQKEILNNLIKKNKLETEVNLLGFVKNIPKLLNYYDAFVISSKSEGLPMVLLEAMLAELPIVSTDVGEIGNILRQSQENYIKPAKDLNDLEKIMELVMKMNKDNLRLIGQNNRKYVEKNYNINILVEQWIKIYFKNYERKNL